MKKTIDSYKGVDIYHEPDSGIYSFELPPMLPIMSGHFAQKANGTKESIMISFAKATIDHEIEQNRYKYEKNN